MNKKYLFILLFLLFPGAAMSASSENTAAINPGLANSLEANRSLLNQYHREYNRLKNEALKDPSPTLEKKMSDLEYKIKALEKDSDELWSFLPVNRRVGEFVKDLMSKKLEEEKIRRAASVAAMDEISQPQPEPPAKPSMDEVTYQLHEQALQYVSEKRYKEALALYEEIVLKNPDDDEAYIIMGHTYILMGQYQKAESAFHNAVSIDPENIHEIAPFYENMVLRNPDDDMAYADLGYAYLILGEAVKAKNAFSESLHINPENGPAQKGLGFTEKILSDRQ